MPSFKFEANGKTFDSKNFSEEKIEIDGPTLWAQPNDTGIFASPPSSAYVTISRNIILSGDRTGELVLCKMAAESLVWNNRDKKQDQWPKGEILFDRTEGNSDVYVQKTELKRIVADSWSLSWKCGNDGQNPNFRGADFRESIAIRAFNVTKTSLTDNTVISVNLGG